ncbi:MAG TPA: glycosyltransferase [Candidatus Paceibacterota bacterium]|nr:glycosyltransferase [Candidatus Paceibacterota bacterium]
MDVQKKRALSRKFTDQIIYAKPEVSVVVPVLDERGNLPLFLERLDRTFENACINYEVIFIDDHSSDGTFEYLEHYQPSFPMGLYRKKGKKGKSYSLLEGITHADTGIIAMIDADLQYPPETIPEMIKKLESADIVVANRKTRTEEKSVRSFLSRVFRNVFGRLLLGTPIDVQSGLKVFRRRVVESVPLSPSKWGFDYEFLYKASHMKWRITEVPIHFAARESGKSKVNALGTGFELLFGGIALRCEYFLLAFFKFLDYPHHSERFENDFENTKDFLFLSDIMSAKKHFYFETVSLIVILLAVFIGISLFLSKAFHVPLLVVWVGISAFFYFFILLFKLLVVWKAVRSDNVLDFSREEIAALRDEDLPLYTVLIPLYQESEVVDQIVRAMTSIDYPPEKLEMIITLEEYDTETIHALENAELPGHMKMLILPDVKPKTKPKALNVALLHTRGVFLSIYDAEIIPDPDQLKKAVLAFQKKPHLGVLQTRLDHYNSDDGVITRLFNSEFSFHYDYFLPGLHKMGIPLPLSGHSTHFRVDMLREIGGWDPYNVTEDCDLGIRLHRRGFQTGLLNSVSREEATSTFRAWANQRSRWMKGFIQTSIVHLRHPLRFKDEIGGWGAFLGFLFVVPGTVLINILNLFFWIIFLVWLIFQPLFVQELFPKVVLYISVFTFLTGNFVFTYLNLLSSYQRGRYSLVKYNLLSIFYWVMLAYATTRGAVQFITNPYYWDKTKHGVRSEAPQTAPVKMRAAENQPSQNNPVNLRDQI